MQFSALPCASLLWHAGIAQTGEISSFAQSVVLRHAAIDCTQAYEARIAIIGAEPASFGEFGGSALAVPAERIGGGETGAKDRMRRDRIAGPFKPDYRFLGLGLQLMRKA
jgi:hypothetical protein